MEQKQDSDKDDIDDAIYFAYNLLNGKTPREMEIISSVHYIHSYYNSITAERIWETINMLKPTANFKQVDVEYALKKLRAKKIIKH